MAYCVHCGNRLAEGQKFCPICNIDITDPLEENKEEKEGIFPDYVPLDSSNVSHKSIIILTTLVFLLPILITVVCDITITGKISWSGYVLFALLMIYVPITVSILSGKINNRHIAAYLNIGCSFVMIGVFLGYVNSHTGGSWFFPFALPLMVVGLAFICLNYSLRKVFLLPRMLMSSIIFLEAGIYLVFVELLINRTFDIRHRLVWSIYPLIVAVLLGLALLWISFDTRLKEKLKRKFFI